MIQRTYNLWGTCVSLRGASLYAGARGQEDFGFAPWPGGSAFPAGLSVQSLVTLAPHFSTAPPGSIWTQKNSIWRGRPPLFFSVLKTKFCAEFETIRKFFFERSEILVRTLRKFCFPNVRNERMFFQTFQKSPKPFGQRFVRGRRCRKPLKQSLSQNNRLEAPKQLF